ncbi:unnamed protein product [Caenorhabditis nigoni]
MVANPNVLVDQKAPTIANILFRLLHLLLFCVFHDNNKFRISSDGEELSGYRNPLVYTDDYNSFGDTYLVH